jgi:hypothetical protein
MELVLERTKLLGDCTIGRLSIDGDEFCYTLEDKFRQREDVDVKEWKVAGSTAIPTGIYKLVLDYSNRFKCIMPHVLDVPGFDGIRIHTGNDADDTEGCIIVGQTYIGGNVVFRSQLAFDDLMSRLRDASGNITLEII